MTELAAAALSLADPFALLLVLAGVLTGLVVGAIPGLNGAMVIALALPLTYGFTPAQAMLLLVALYVGAISGGLVTAILFRIPGTPASVVTTFDGHPMALRGEAGRALKIAIGSSFVGGMVAAVALFVISEPLSRAAAHLSFFDMFALVILAMTLIAFVSEGRLVAGLLSGLLGMLAAMPGYDPSSGQLRLTAGQGWLSGGFGLLPVLIGVFAVSQAMGEVLSIGRKGEVISMTDRGRLGLRFWGRAAPNMLRSGVIGTVIGVLPGIGAAIGSLVAYAAARGLSKSPHQFGTGADAGIVASESANNATVGGALVPLVAMGIPGSVIDAVLLGALLVHGLKPGPLLFTTNPDVVYSIMVGYVAANVAMVVMLSLLVGRIAKLVLLPRAGLVPAILVFCVVGSYAISGRMTDVWIMIGFGIAGFLLERARIPLGPFVIGIVLAPIAETSLRSGLMSTAGDPTPLFVGMVSGPLLALSLLLILIAAIPCPAWLRVRP